MSQHDFNIANQGFPSFRTDLNNALVALATTSSGTAEPATTYANQLWYETDTNILHIRDEANAAWLDLMTINQTTGSPSFMAGDVGIGTTSPDAPLHLANGTSADFILEDSGGGTLTDAQGKVEFQRSNNIAFGGLYVTDGTTDLNISTKFSTGFLTFSTDTGTERMRITSTGNVGIGTTTPGAGLHVNSGIANLVGLFESTDAGALITLIDNSTTGGSAAQHGLNTVGDELEVRAVSTLTFETAATERMRIDASGNVGIGLTPSTSAPLTNVSAGLLQVNGNVELRYLGSNFDPAGARYFNIVNTDTTLVADQPLGGIQWVGLDTDNPNSNMASITSYCSGNTGTTGDLRFKIAGTERARIDSSGNLLVGMTSVVDAGRMNLSFDNATQRGVVTTSNQTAASDHFLFRNPNGQVGSIRTTNSTTAYNTSSDYRLKENVQPMTGALDTITQLKPVTYTWKVDGLPGQGFIAHELQAVVPDCVTGEKDAVDEDGNPQYQGVDTSFLVATLVKAIQELTDRVAELENR